MSRPRAWKQWDIQGLTEAMEREFEVSYPIQQWLDEDHNLHEETLRQRVLGELEREYKEKEALVGSENLRMYEKAVMLEILDNDWKEHLAAMDYLRQGIHLRGYAQKNPKQEYKREAFEMFARMLDAIKQEVVAALTKIKVRTQEEMDIPYREQQTEEFQFQHEEFTGFDEEAAPEAAAPEEGEMEHKPFVRSERKVGRNEPCPCGSGKKYKQCHGKLQ
jgi:preprotein translocase subunit SecA